MNRRFRHGLVVGKFSPLHRGHELLIGRAVEECRQVSVISYAKPEYPGCDTVRREQWLTALFPEVRRLVVDDERLAVLFPGSDISLPHDDEPEVAHRRFCGMLCREALGATVDAVFTSEGYGDGFAAELTSFFREHDPQVSPVTHVSVDPERMAVPVSGTMARSDIHSCRQFLAPQVYSSFITRVCILGGESSGKSTLARALADRFATAMVPEYGRELWEAKSGALEFPDMLAIGERQLQLEGEALLTAHRFLFCDTSPLTTMFYSDAMFSRCDPGLERLAGHPYDLYLLCSPDFPFVQDGTRQQPGFRDRQDAWYREELIRRGIQWVDVTGSVAERVAQVEGLLNKPEGEHSWR